MLRRVSFVAIAALTCSCAGTVGPIKILDDRAQSLIDEKEELEVLGDGFAWTEGPLWIEDGGYLLFSDVPNNVIHKYVPGEGVSLYLDKSGSTGLVEGDSVQGSNGLLLNDEGELVLFQQGDRRVAVMDAPLTKPVGRFRTLVGRHHGRRLNSPNDGVFSSDGSLFFTDPPYGLDGRFEDERRELDFQGIYRLSANGELELLDDTVSAPNGIGLSIDDETLYVAVSDESNPHWLAYDVLADGTLANKRVFFDATEASRQYPGNPDGMTVHSSGVILATGPGGVWLFSPEGDVLARIFTGRWTANCKLSTDEKTLFITAHDTLLALQLK
ncbi:MAG: SMP-30/gluconolactonase/LRE family protein [Woeseiaceae bacterium]